MTEWLTLSLSLKSERQNLHEWIFFFLLFLISTYSLSNDHKTGWSSKGHPLRRQEEKAPLQPEDWAHPQSVRQMETTAILMRWLDGSTGHESDQTLGDGEGQGSLTCCSPWGCKESDTTERLNWLHGMHGKCIHIFFIHSSVDGHISCFYVLVIVNSAPMNIGVHIPFWIKVFSGYMPRSEIAGS